MFRVSWSAKWPSGWGSACGPARPYWSEPRETMAMHEVGDDDLDVNGANDAGEDGNGDAVGDEPRRRRRILRDTAVLPAMFTVMNGLAGFGSIHFATKAADTDEVRLAYLTAAAWLVFVALLFDMLDGRLARMTRRTSDFGAQLDSLSDIVSFGVAPAVLMLRTVVLVLQRKIERISLLEIDILPDFMGIRGVESVVWCVAATYLACGLLRLAKFNVEHDPDESAHMNFSGLPIPGAAALVAALVLLFTWLTPIETGWRSSDWVLIGVSITLPIATLATAMLMVSSMTYPHLVNQYIRGKRPFSYLVKFVVIALFALLMLPVTISALTIAYAMSGPARKLWQVIRRRRENRAKV